MGKISKSILIAVITSLLLAVGTAQSFAAQNEVIATIPVGANPYNIAISPDGKTAAVPNNTGDSVTFIDLQTNSVITNVAGFTAPSAVAYSPDGSLLYVTAWVGGIDLYEINTSNYLIAAVTSTNISCDSSSISVTNDGSRLFMNCLGSPSDTIQVISLPSGTRSQISLPSGSSASQLTLSPDNRYLYATLSSDQLVKIDTQTSTISGITNVGNIPEGVVTSIDGSKIYVANLNNHNVDVVDSQTMTVSSSISLQAGAEPVGLAITPDGSKLLVADSRNNSLEIINTVNFNIEAIIPVGDTPFYVSVTPNGSFAYVSNSQSNNISVIDLRAPVTPETPTLPTTSASPWELIPTIFIALCSFLLGGFLILRSNKTIRNN